MPTSAPSCDILYIHPAKQEPTARYDQFVSSPPYAFLPVGVVGLLNLLRAQGWSVGALNLPLELLRQPTFDFNAWLRARPRPQLVLIDLHWYEHCFGALEVARAVKGLWPYTPIALGGLTASHFAREILEFSPDVDYIIRGDAEEPLHRLAELYCASGATPLARIPNLTYRERGKIHETPLRYTATAADLDALDFVATDWLLHQAEYAALQYSGAGVIALQAPRLKGHWLSIGRGCVFDCIFCGGGRDAHARLAERSGLVLRTPSRVVDDIARLQAAGYHQVSLALDPAMTPPAYWRELFALLRQRGVRVGLYNEFFQLPSDEFLEAFVAAADLAHTEVALSPLSGDEAVRRRNGKFFSNARLWRVLEVLRAHRIPIFVYFSLNLPGETPATFAQTLALAEQIGAAYPHDLLRMLNSCHTLDPASPLTRTPADDIEVQYRTFRDYYTYCKGTAWQPRLVTRGQHRGYEMRGRPATVVEQMAQGWDAFASRQEFRCYPVPRGW